MDDPLQLLEKELEELRRDFDKRAGAMEKKIAALKRASIDSDAVCGDTHSGLGRAWLGDSGLLVGASNSSTGEGQKEKAAGTPSISAKTKVSPGLVHGALSTKGAMPNIEASVAWPERLAPPPGPFGNRDNTTEAGNDAGEVGELTLDVDLEPAKSAAGPAPDNMGSDGMEEGHVDRESGSGGGGGGGIFKEFIESRLEPFGGAIQWLTAVYRHYRDRGKGTEFLMTVSGILALVLGFGYLLQYSFVLISPELKAAGAFTAASAVTICGALLSRRKTGMGDYGAGLIGLGVVLNYLSAYAAGPYYAILGTAATFLVLFLNTAVAYLLAMLFTTRVVAAITLLGGAFFPLVLGGALPSPLIFISYLLLLSGACLHLAVKIRWKALEYLTMAVSGVMIERVAVVEPLMLIHLHAFIYLYGARLLFSGKRLKETLERAEIGALIALIIMFALAVFQVTGERFHGGAALLFNAGICSVIFTFSGNRPGAVRAVFLLVAGFFAGIAVLAVCRGDVAGAVLGLEALFLVFLGFRLKVPSVRREGYVVMGGSALMTLVLLVKWLTAFQTADPLPSWSAYALLGTVLLALCRLMAGHKAAFSGYEKRLLPFLQNAFSFWIASFFQVTCLIGLPAYLPVLSIFPCLLLIRRAGKLGLKFTEYLGLAHYGLIGAQVAVSGNALGSFQFFDQPLLGKIARIELYASLWGLKAFYDRFHAESGFAPAARGLRTVFYLLVPVCYLPTLWKFFPELVPIGLWGSVGIGLVISRMITTPVFFRELEILTGVAVLTAYAASFGAPQTGFILRAALPLGIGAAFFFLILYALRGKTPAGFKDEPLSRIATGGYYYFGITAVLLVFKLTGAIGAALCSGSLYFFLYAVKWPVAPPLRSAWNIFYMTGLGFLVALTLYGHPPGSAQWGPLFNIAAICVFGYTAHCNRPHSSLLARSLGGRKFQLWSFHILVFATCLICSTSWTGDFRGPAVTLAGVIQGTAALFLTLTPRYRDLVAIPATLFLGSAAKVLLYDMAGFSSVEKVIAFMGIGVILLLGAYRFQRVRESLYRP